MQYRKKPVCVEARRCDESTTPPEIAAWCGGKACGGGDLSAKQWIEIPTLEGTMRADFGDWIIRGVKGEFYPCKPDIFEATYESVEQAAELPEPTGNTLQAKIAEITQVVKSCVVNKMPIPLGAAKVVLEDLRQLSAM